jgi:hypothetical protein
VLENCEEGAFGPVKITNIATDGSSITVLNDKNVKTVKINPKSIVKQFWPTKFGSHVFNY